MTSSNLLKNDFFWFCTRSASRRSCRLRKLSHSARSRKYLFQFSVASWRACASCPSSSAMWAVSAGVDLPFSALSPLVEFCSADISLGSSITLLYSLVRYLFCISRTEIFHEDLLYCQYKT